MEGKPAVSAVTLRFLNRNLEEEFQQDYFFRNLKRRRLICLLGAFIYAVFYFMDMEIIPELNIDCLVIRFAIVCPLILLAYLIHFTRFGFRLRNINTLMCGVAASLGIIYMIAHASSPGNHIYYGGLVLCALFYYLIVPEWIISNIISWLTFAVFEIVIVFFIELPWEYRFGNSYIFFFFNLSGMFACYMLERTERIAFWQRRTIQRQAEELRRSLEHANGEWRQAESLARLDPLTGLVNRRYFFQLADGEMARRHRHPQPLSLLMVDVDHFKQFNDRYGHQLGDLVLKKVADAIASTIRKPDTAGRFGGEEFIVLLPETGQDAAARLGQRLLEAIQGEKLEHRGELLGVTASLGVGTLDEAEQVEMSILLKRADEALYAAKNSGRNQLKVWKEPSSCRPEEDRFENLAVPSG